MPVDGGPGTMGQGSQVAAPVAGGGRRAAVFGRYGVEHEVEQVVFGCQVAVERGCARSQFLGDAPHGQCLDALGVGDRDSGAGDLRPGA